ncbi:hypothetical protein ZWY2020_016754 [Hordeum vulgare]|nr:hypothetical protein ZWY2020_016754 [Hordeum vulgare]
MSRGARPHHGVRRRPHLVRLRRGHHADDDAEQGVGVRVVRGGQRAKALETNMDYPCSRWADGRHLAGRMPSPTRCAPLRHEPALRHGVPWNRDFRNPPPSPPPTP